MLSLGFLSLHNLCLYVSWMLLNASGLLSPYHSSLKLYDIWHLVLQLLSKPFSLKHSETKALFPRLLTFHSYFIKHFKQYVHRTFSEMVVGVCMPARSVCWTSGLNFDHHESLGMVNSLLSIYPLVTLLIRAQSMKCWWQSHKMPDLETDRRHWVNTHLVCVLMCLPKLR